MSISERAIQAEIIVDGSLDDVWAVWTTPEGIRSFFAPDCNVELAVNGPYEIFFAPEAEPGLRGGEGLRFLAIQPQKMLSFTWNAPPSLPEARQQLTHMVVRFQAISKEKTRVMLRHDGWGDGGEWDQAFEYFDHAWNKVVLPRLQYRFAVGPVDWDNPPI